MSIKLEMHFSSFEELAKFAAQHVTKEEPKKSAPEKAPAADPKKTAAAKAEKNEPAPAAEDDLTETDESDDDEQPSFDTIREALFEVNRKKGKGPTMKILEKYGLQKLNKSVLEKKRGKEFVEDCKKALAA